MATVLLQQRAGSQLERSVLGGAKHQLKAQPGVHYQVVDELTGKPPKQLVVKRSGEKLVIEVEGQPLLELLDYYNGSLPDEMAYVDIAQSDGRLLSLTQATRPVGAAGSDYVLYAAQDTDDGAADPLPEGAATLLLAGLGLAGLAALGGGGGGGGSGPGVAPQRQEDPTPPQPAAPTAYLDDIGSVQHAQSSAPTTDSTRPGLHIAPVSAGSSPKLYVDGAEVAATYDPQKGTLTPVNPLPPGGHALAYSVKSAAGKESPQSAPLQLTIDLTPPAGNLAFASLVDSGASAADGITSDNAFDLSLTGLEAGTTAVYQVSADGGATWSATTARQAGVADGTLQYRVQLTDAAGNAGISAPIRVTVDTVAPAAGALEWVNLADTGSGGSDGITSDNTFELTLAGQEPGAQVAYQVSSDGGATWHTTEAVQAGVADGTYQYRAQLTDAAGNSATTAARTVTVMSTVAPGTLAFADLADSGSSATDGITSDNAFTLTLADQQAGTTVAYEVSSDGGATWASTTAAQADLADGTWTYRAQVTDAAGNSAASAPLSVTVDATPPAPGTLAFIDLDDSGTSVTDNVTSDRTFDLGLSGQEAGATVEYQVSGDGGASWTSTTAAQVDVADGTYLYRVQVSDVAGNVGTGAPSGVTIDATAPDAGTLAFANLADSGAAGDGITSDGTFELSLTGQEAGATVVYQVSADGGATWSSTTAAQASMADGTWTYRAVLTDAAGNSAATAPISVTVDGTPPAAGALAFLNLEDSGSSVTDNVTSDRTFELGLTGQEAGATVDYQVSSDGGASWTSSTAAQANVADGAYLYRAQLTDVAGNVSTGAPISVTVDATAPDAGTLAFANLTDSGIAGDGITSDSTFDLSLTGQEAGATVVYQVSNDGGATWSSTTAAQANVADGTYAYRAQVTDAAGNSAATAPITVTVDGAIAAGTLAFANLADSGIAGDGITSDNSFDLSLTGQKAGATVVYQVSTDGGATWQATTAAQSGLADGTYQFRAEVSDTAGNTATNAPISVTIDRAVAPGTLAFANLADSGRSATDGITSDNSFELSLTGQEAGTTVVYQRSGDGGATWNTTTAAQAAVADGSYVYRAQVTDAAGNVGTTAPVSVTLDTTAPAVAALAFANLVDSGSSASDQVTSDNSFNLALTGQEAGATVVYEVSADGGATWNTTTAAQANMADGTYRYRARVSDAAGNVSISAPVGVTVDATAPAAGTLAFASLADSGASATDSITSDNTFDLSLTGQEAGATVVYQVSSDGGATWSATTAAQAAVADGTRQYRAQVSDTAGNVATTAPISVTVDTTAPAAGALAFVNLADSGSSASDRVTSDNSFELDLTGGEAGATRVYQVSSDGGATWNATTAAQANVADGAYQYRAVLTDAAGNASTSAAIGITVDTAAPAAGTLAFANLVDSGDSASDGITSDNSFDLSLAGQEAGATVVYQVSGDGGLTWSATTAVQSNVADGAYRYRAQVTDAAGNVGTTAPVSVTVDASAPAAPALAFANLADSGSSATDYITSDNTFDLSLTGQEAGTTVRYQRSSDGGATWSDTTAAQTNVADGGYRYRAQLTDVAGNVSTSAPVSVTVDASAPAAGTLALANLVDGGSSATDRVSNDNSFTLSLAGHEAGATVVHQISTDGGATWATTTAAQAGVADGAYQYRAQVTDAAGNVSTTAPVGVVIDTVAPAAGTLAFASLTDTGSSATDGITSDRTFDLSLTGYEAGATIVYQVSTDGGLTWTATTAAQANVADGVRQYRAQVIDTAGNLSTTASISVAVDATAPALPTARLASASDTGADNADGVTALTTPTYAGTAEAGAAVSVTIGAHTYTTTAAPDGTFSVSVPEADALSEGTYTPTIVVTDAAGNATTANGTPFTVAMPLATIAQSIDDVGGMQGSVADGGETDDTRPVLSGTLDQALLPGAVLAIYDGANRLGYAVVDGTDWTYTSPELAAGHHHITARVEHDAVAGTASAPYDVKVQTLSSITTTGIASQAPNLEKVRYVMIRYNGDNDGALTLAEVEVMSGGVNVALGKTVSGGYTPLAAGARTQLTDGNYSTRAASYFSDSDTWDMIDLGAFYSVDEIRLIGARGNIQVYASDISMAGLTMAKLAAGTNNAVWVGTVAPAGGNATFTAPTSGLSDPRPTLSGTLGAALDSGQQLGIYEGTHRVGTATTNGTSWTFQPTSDFTPGTHVLRAEVENTSGVPLGVRSPSTTFFLAIGVPNQTVQVTGMSDNFGAYQGAVALAPDALTDDSKVQLSGTLSGPLNPGEYLKVYDGATLLGYATVNGTSWNFTTGVLAPGQHSLHARVESPGGQGGFSAAVPVYVQYFSTFTVNDNEGEIRGTVANNAQTDDTTPTLSGTMAAALVPGTRVGIYDNGVRIGQATVNADQKTWSYTTGILSEGTHEFSARLEDSAGNPLGAIRLGSTVNVRVLAAPTAQATITAVTDDVAPFTGVVASDGITNDNAPLIRGTLNAPLNTANGDVVAIYDNGVRIGTAVVDGTGLAWTYSSWPYDGQAGYNHTTPGLHRFTARVENASGYAPYSNSYNITIMSVAITNYADNAGAESTTPKTYATGTATDDATPTIQGNLGATPAGIQVAIYDGATRLGLATLSGANWSFTPLIPLTEGVHSIQARVEYTDGTPANVQSAIFQLNVTLIPPLQTATIVSVSDDFGPQTGSVAQGGLTDDRTPRLAGTVSAALGMGYKVQVFDNGVYLGDAAVVGTSWSYTVPSRNAGNHQFTVKVVNGAGAGASSNGVDIVVQTLGMTITDDVGMVTGEVAHNGVTDDLRPHIAGTIGTPLGANQQVAIYEGAVKLGVATVNGTTWQYGFDTDLTIGSHSLRAQLEDGAGAQLPVSALSLDFVVQRLGTSGDDTISITAADLAALQSYTGTRALVDGSGGVDTVRIDLSGVIDLIPVRTTAVQALEAFDLMAANGKAATLALTAQEVMDMTLGTDQWDTLGGAAADTGRHQLKIDGGAGDAVDLDLANWTLKGTVTNGGITYNIYDSNTLMAELLIASTVTVI